MEATSGVVDGSLGNTTKFPSHRIKRYALQALARELLPGERINACMRNFANRPDKPMRAEVWYSPEKKKAHYGGLMQCGSVWVCPICAPKITERRRLELAQAFDAWQVKGGSVFMVTYTNQHSREDKLVDIVEDLKKGYSSYKSGAGWVSIQKRYGLVGDITDWENTVSLANGWHPHLHVLYFSTLQPEQIDVDQLKAEITARFVQVMGRRGRYVSGIYGVDVAEPRRPEDAKTSYVTKWGLDAELAKSPVKSAKDDHGVKHYSPFQLLELYADGNKWAGALFREYASAMKRHHQLQWSKGLRNLLGLEKKEKTDAELAIEEVETGDQLLAALSWEEWRLILANDARADLLNVADSGDIDRVRSFLAMLGIRSFYTP